MKLRLVSLLLVLALALTAVFCVAMAEEDTIKIGAMYALSGDKAAIGTNIMRGVNFAADMINAQGGINGKKIEIVPGDTQGDAKIAGNLAERLITEDHVVAIMGCHQSTLTDIVAQVCEEYEIPLITAISTLDSLSTNNYQYFFRLCPMNSVYVEDMFKYLSEQSQQTGKEVKTVSIFADNSAIGQELIRCAKIYAPLYNMDIIETVEYQGGAADLTSEVLTLKKANADAVLCESYIADAILFTKTLAEQDYHPEFVVAKANGFADVSYIPATEGISNGIATVVEWNPDLTKGQDINAAYKAEYGLDMNGHSAESFTVVWLFKTAIEAAGTTEGAAVKAALEELVVDGTFPNGPEIILPYASIDFNNYEVSGVQHYHNNAFASVAIAQVQDGQFKTVWPLEYAGAPIQYPAQLK